MYKKISIFLIVIIFVIGIFLLIYVKTPKDDEYENNGMPKINETKKLIINNGYWKYNNKWEYLSKLTSEKEKYNVYINSSFIGLYFLEYSNTWNIFDNNDNFINYEGDLLAFSENFNVIVRNTFIEEISNIELSEIHSIGYNVGLIDLSNSEKIVIDLDNNGVMDKIVSVSNLDSENQSKYFNLLYVVLNDNVEVLINEEVSFENLFKEPIYNLKYVLNFENENCDSIIVQEGYFSNVGETKYIILQMVSGNYNMIIE